MYEGLLLRAKLLKWVFRVAVFRMGMGTPARLTDCQRVFIVEKSICCSSMLALFAVNIEVAILRRPFNFLRQGAMKFAGRKQSEGK